MKKPPCSICNFAVSVICIFRVKTTLLLSFVLLITGVDAQDRTKIPPLKPLSQIPVPMPSNLDDFIEDMDLALVLGKALFWDMQVGSDGVMACATCHFHAGADNRSRHQASPGLLRWYANGASNPDRTFQLVGSNYALKVSDFPLRKLRNPNDSKSSVLSRFLSVSILVRL